MSKNTNIVVTSGTFRSVLAASWKRVLEGGGPLVMTVTGIPEFAIYPLAVFIPTGFATEVMDFARSVFALQVDRPVPEGWESNMPVIGNDTLRRTFGEERTRIRTLMTPFAYTRYFSTIGILFPIPSQVDGWIFIDNLTRAWYPERYEGENEETS